MPSLKTAAGAIVGIALMLLPETAAAQNRYGLPEDEYRQLDEFREFWNSLPADKRANVELPETDELIRCSLSDQPPCRTRIERDFLEQFRLGWDEAVSLEAPSSTEIGIERLAYGSRGGESVRVVGASGIDTALSTIDVQLDTEGARLHCVNYLGNTETSCPQEVITNLRADGFRNSVIANCETGDFTNLFGSRYRFEGRQAPGDRVAEYRVRDIVADEILGPGMASNYPVLIEVFAALCPARVETASTETVDDGLADDGRQLSELEWEQIEVLQGAWRKESGGACEDADEGLINVRGTEIPGYHYACEILNTTAASDGIIGILSCSGEGEEWSGTIQHSRSEPDAMRTVFLSGGSSTTTRYARCEGSPRAFSAGQ